MTFAEKLIKKYDGDCPLDPSEKARRTVFKKYVKKHDLTTPQISDFFLYFVQMDMPAGLSLSLTAN